MKAALCRRYGGPEVLELSEVADPQPGPGQVVIDVEACAINFPDLLMLENKYQFKPPLPFSPGGEVAGVVSAVGPGVEGARMGERVVASCGWGGLAERVAVGSSQMIPLPGDFPPEQACGLLYAYGTAQHALVDRARIQPGETLLVLGAAGGVGLAAVELGTLLGATVIAAASSEEKLALCREHGAAMTVNYSAQDLKATVRELTGGFGADVVYDPVGGPYSEPALRAMAWDGRFLVIGFAAGEIPRIPLNLVLLRGCSVVGVFWGSFTQRFPDRHQDNVAQLLSWWREGQLRPHVSATFPLEQASEALRELAERRALGKVVVTLGRPR